MFKKISTIAIWSENYRRLANWYQAIFDFKSIEEPSHPKDTGVLWELPGGGCLLWVGQHSEIKGANKNPLRIMFNIDVDSVQQTFDYLAGKDVKVIAKPFESSIHKDVYFATFSDPDDNVFQITGPK